MPNEIITIREMLDYMQVGGVFSLTVVSYDRKRKRGGQVKQYAEARLLGAEENKPKRSRKATLLEARALAPKHPDHLGNYTRNIRLMQNGADTSLIRKIHPPLVVTFNNKTVVP